jgi:hypothetical protein
MSEGVCGAAKWAARSFVHAQFVHASPYLHPRPVLRSPAGLSRGSAAHPQSSGSSSLSST